MRYIFRTNGPFAIVMILLFMLTGCDKTQDDRVADDRVTPDRVGSGWVGIKSNDTKAPTITDFSLTGNDPAAYEVITFTLKGRDNAGIEYWMVNESSVKPGSDDPRFSTDKPANHTLSGGYGIKTVYAWAMDAAGNVSDSASFKVSGIQKSWSVAGRVTITDTSVTANDRIGLGAYYTRGELRIEDNRLVSNAVDVTGGGDFTLDIDASNLWPADRDVIKLVLWKYVSGDGASSQTDSVKLPSLEESEFNISTEEYDYTKPSSGCPVFESAFDCTFVYFEEDGITNSVKKGWNVDRGSDYDSVSTATLRGAAIENWAWFKLFTVEQE